MAIEGKVRTLYTDKTQQEAIFPTTKVSAVTDDEGNGLNTLLEHIAYVDPMDMESAAVLANADLLGGYPASDYAFIEDLKNLKPEDIGAAPSGFGFGEEIVTKTINDCNAAIATGLYKVNANSANCPPNFTVGTFMLVESYSNNSKIQRITTNGSATPVYATRIMSGGVWGEWEYINPPMTLGVEYRTTERYEGKPVYTKMVNTGPMTNGSYFIYAEDATRPIRCFVTVDNSLLPDYVGGALVGGNWSKWYDISGKTFTAYMGTNFTHIGYRLQVWYIK